MTPLNQLRPGQTAKVTDVQATGLLGRRLLDLGFVPGTEVRVERAGPLGDPRSYQIRSSRFALRSHQAQQILVRPQPPTAP
jgi:ferrous iron transport protein A